MKKGILAVSFGTSHIDTMERRLTCSKRSLQKRLKKLLYTGRLQAI